MKTVFFATVVLLALGTAQSAFASQNWLCEGTNKEGAGVKVYFLAHSNTVISQILVTDDNVIVSRINGQVRRDAKSGSDGNSDENQFNIDGKEMKLNLLLPRSLGSMDDEFAGFLEKSIGNTAKAETIQLDCNGAGGE